MKHLIITADDFGLSEEVNAAVETAHRQGILSAASLMVGGPAAADAIARAHRLPNLRVGLHLVLVDGQAVSSRSDIPNLLDGKGRLRSDLAHYGTQIMFDPSLRRQIAREISAQFALYRASGLPMDHVNAHRHFHLHPTIAAMIITIGRDYGMRAMRVPNEPRRMIAGIDPRARRGMSWITGPWTSWLRLRARRDGLTIADAVYGLTWSGAMTAVRLKALIDRLPAGVFEIYLHPALTNVFAGAAPGYRYAEEFAALCDEECVAAVRRFGATPGGYMDIGAP